MNSRPQPNQPPDPLRPVLARLTRMMNANRFSEAFPQLVTLRQKAPRDPRVLWMLGACNAELGRHAESIEAYDAAVRADPRNVQVRLGLVVALQRGGDNDRALLEIERVLYQRPGNFQALRLRASVLLDNGQPDKAAEVVATLLSAPGLDQQPAQARTALILTAARLAPEHRDIQKTIDELGLLAADPACPIPTRVSAEWQLGRLNDKLGRFDLAFEAYTRCKGLTRQPWNPDDHSRRVDQLIECWSAGCGVPKAERDGSRLIFILGMMRSGTSLTEQMLAQLPEVTPGGELNAVSRQVAEVDPMLAGQLRPLPVSREKYTQAVINTMSRRAWVYYDKIAAEGRVTDKQPYNCYYVPLLARLFPGCRIIHCTRDAQDTCLSNYFQSYSRPHPHTHDLEWLGRYYRDYQRLMDAWHALPGINMIDLNYESLVEDPRTQTGRAVEFLGLPWDDGVLNFHQSDRTVRTSSRDQVRRPLYKSSVSKHEQYAAHLAPLRRGLGLE